MDIVQIDSSSEKNVIARAVVVLRGGGTLVYPTETVYGLGVDATNQEAVNKLLKFKGQRGRKPILIAVSDQQMAEKYVELNDVARRLYQMFLPGPMAVVSRAKPEKVPEVPKVSKVSKVSNGKEKEAKIIPSDASGTSGTSGTFGTSSTFLARGIASIDNTVGVRIPNYPLMLKIVKQFGKPITSTSANVSGSRNPWSINDIIETTLKNKLELIDLILDAGQLPKRPPSTVVDTSREETEIVREGYLAERLKVLDSETRTRRAKGRRTKEEKFVSQSPDETIDIAKRLMNGLFRPSSLIPHPSALVLALQGPMGAGKTVFARGIARSLGIIGPIRSPSYTLVREYPIPHDRFHKLRITNDELRMLYHIDAWRLSDPSEFQDFGLDRMLQHGNIIVIEWIERLKPILSNLQKSAKVVLIQIEVTNEYERNIKIAM